MSMIQEKIEQAFERHPYLRTLFFFDPEGTYRADYDSLEPKGFQCHEVGNAYFATKAKLAREWKDERVVLYLNVARPSTQAEKHQFALLGELVASRALELDDVGDFLEQFALDEVHRPLVSKWISELRLKHVQETCAGLLKSDDLNEKLLIRGMVASFLDLKQPEEWGVLAARMLTWFASDREKKWSSFQKRIRSLELGAAVSEQCALATGLPLSGLEDHEVQQWAEAIQYNRIVNGLNKADLDPYAQLKVASYDDETRFRQFLQQVNRHPLAGRFVEAVDALGTRVKGESLLAVYGNTARFGAMPNAMFWGFAERMMAMLKEKPEEVRHTISNQRYVPAKDSEQAHLREFILHAADLLASLPSGMDAHVLDTPAQYVEQYTQEWHKLDRLYRQAISAFKACDLSVAPDATNDLATASVSLVQGQYDEHVDRMNREWLKCLADVNFDYSRIGVPLQSRFYDEHVAGSATKVAVIISDALRFEAARELLEVMHADPKNTAVMGHCLASIPSRTSVGMAQLLPGPKSWSDGAILAFGTSTASTHRDAVLKQALPNSAAIRAKDLDGMAKADQREIFKHEVVYVYHDIIDSISDKRATEHMTFDNVSKAVEDLDKLVRLLHGSLAVRRVIVTADHGFLYTDRNLEDAELEKIPVDETLEQNNRFFLTDEQQDLAPLGYSFPFSATTGIESSFFVNIPASTNRYRIAGAGHRFVHGGGSLQELVVPVLESKRKKEDVINRVGLDLLNPKKLKVVSSRMRLNLFQEEPVGRNAKARTVLVGLYHPTSGELLSNEATVNLNSVAEAPSERIQTIELTMAVHSGNHSTVKLKIRDVEDLLNPLEDQLIINNTLIEPDF